MKKIDTNKELSDYCDLYVDLESKEEKDLIRQFKKRFGKRGRVHPIELTDSPKSIPVFISGLTMLESYESIGRCLGLWVAERYFDGLTRIFSKKDKVEVKKIISYLTSKYPDTNRDFILDISKSWMESYSNKIL